MSCPKGEILKKMGRKTDNQTSENTGDEGGGILGEKPHLCYYKIM
jgi:hypothetical protein